MDNYRIDNVEEFVLDNGLRILIKENKSAPVFTCQLWFKVGSIDEPFGLSGSAHLIEHMLFRSSKNFKGGEISQILRGYGGIDNAATSYDYTYYWVLLGPQYLEFALKIMAERFYPLFDKEELKKEIGVVLSEMEGYENRPTSVLSQSLSNTLFERSPYRRPIIGYREDLENINRENLIDFYKKFYIPNNATLVLAGDIDRNKAIECINKYFAPVSKGKVPYRKYYSEPSQKSFKSLSVDFCGETEISYFGFHIPNIYHKDADALTMLGSILSDGKNSRLYKSLVSTGKAVQVYAAPLLRKLESFFVIDVTANSQYKSDDFSEEVIKALEDVKKMPVTEEEIKTCLNQLKADIIYETDSVSGLGNALGMADVYGNWKDYNEQIPRLEKVTPKDISRVLNKYFVPNNCTLVSTYHVKKQKYVNVPKGKPEKTGKIKCLLPETTDVILNNLSDNKKWICPKKFILQNGITVIVSENKGSSTVAVEGFVRHGDMYEPINQPGVSDMTARMLSSGTETRNYLEIAKSLDSVGAYIDFDISCEKLSFSGKSLSEYTDLLLYNLADCLVHSVFPEDRISFSQDAFLADLYYNKEVPNKSASNIFYNNVVEKGKPYYLASADETIEYIKKITRKDIFDFYSELRPEDTVIAIAGDVDGDKISELCNKYFSDFESGKKKKYITESVYSIPDDMKVFDIPMEKKSEAAVLYGYPINMKRESEDFYKFKLCNQILGGGGALNSRFGIEIRENRGLVYGISSGFSGGKFNGIWRVGFGTNRKSVDEALGQVHSIMQNLLDNGVSDKELNDTKNFILGMFAKSLETNEGMASMLASAEDYNLGLDYMHKIKDMYMPVTTEDIKDVAEKYIYPNKGITVICG